MSSLSALKTALDATGIPFAHHAWSHAPDGTYGVYAEDDSIHEFADGKMVNQALQGTVDLFTRDDSDTPRTTVQTALASLDIPWYLNSVQYEQDTGYIHYEWVFEVTV